MSVQISVISASGECLWLIAGVWPLAAKNENHASAWSQFFVWLMANC